jgi:hypothetical protein
MSYIQEGKADTPFPLKTSSMKYDHVHHPHGPRTANRICTNKKKNERKRPDRVSLALALGTTSQQLGMCFDAFLFGVRSFQSVLPRFFL